MSLVDSSATVEVDSRSALWRIGSICGGAKIARYWKTQVWKIEVQKGKMCKGGKDKYVKIKYE